MAAIVLDRHRSFGLGFARILFAALCIVGTEAFRISTDGQWPAELPAIVVFLVSAALTLKSVMTTTVELENARLEIAPTRDYVLDCVGHRQAGRIVFSWYEGPTRYLLDSRQCVIRAETGAVGADEDKNRGSPGTLILSLPSGVTRGRVRAVAVHLAQLASAVVVLHSVGLLLRFAHLPDSEYFGMVGGFRVVIFERIAWGAAALLCCTLVAAGREVAIDANEFMVGWRPGLTWRAETARLRALRGGVATGLDWWTRARMSWILARAESLVRGGSASDMPREKLAASVIAHYLRLK
jgi:hypothetical protein